MDNKQFARQLEERTLNFAVRIIGLSSKLPNTSEGWVVRNQLTKAGTSVGANYREANRSRSKPEFKSKIKVFESEASETNYWLTIVRLMEWLTSEETEWEFNESKELLSIFSSIGKKLTS